MVFHQLLVKLYLLVGSSRFFYSPPCKNGRITFKLIVKETQANLWIVVKIIMYWTLKILQSPTPPPPNHPPIVYE